MIKKLKSNWFVILPVLFTLAMIMNACAPAATTTTINAASAPAGTTSEYNPSTRITTVYMARGDVCYLFESNISCVK